MTQVLGGLSGRSLRSHIRLGQTTIDDEVSRIDEAALIASQEDDGVSLFNGLSETTGREVNLTTEALLLVVTEPVLQKGGAAFISFVTACTERVYSLKRSGTQRVEPETCIITISTIPNTQQQRSSSNSPSLACTIANSRVIANTAPLLAVYAS